LGYATLSTLNQFLRAFNGPLATNAGRLHLHNAQRSNSTPATDRCPGSGWTLLPCAVLPTNVAATDDYLVYKVT